MSAHRLAQAPAFGALLMGCIVSLVRDPAGLTAEPPAAAAEVEDATGVPDDPGSALGSFVDRAVDEAMTDRKVPGAVVVIGRHDGVLLRRAYGFREVLPDRVPMTLDTVFDLASLTKPVATATSIMALVDRGTVGLDDPVGKYVPECAGGGKGAITLRHLLLHVSGLPADTAFGDFEHGREAAIRGICDAKMRAAPGVKSIYSDIGFILLEEVVRRVTGKELPDFANEAIFAPLGMKDTGFVPTGERKARAAWTEEVDGEWRAGVVHDPRAFRLGGVAGHAGLFSTGDDLARYARAILGRGQVEGRRILSAATVDAMTAPYDVPGGIRTLGWQVDSTWKSAALSPRAFGHFGFTGTALWIDPDADLFIVLLTNRVHPDGTGDSKPLLARVSTLAAQAIAPGIGRVDACVDRPDDVHTGIDVLRDEGFARLQGAHVGLITNASGRTRDGTSTIDVLAGAPELTLVALFTPEHGMGADREGKIAGGVDEKTGLPVYSLYGETFAPTTQMLAGIDTLVFDVQDVGTRFFTYGSTMRRAMEVARDHDLRFVVLDRPDPIDGVDVAGPMLVPPPGSRSFVNYHALPVRHGMTIGELAWLFDADDHMGVDLSIVPMRGWRRASYGDETGLPWVNPSPNLHRVIEALLYPALGLLESTNVSVGRGTDAPFERLGAPWIDGDALASALAAEPLAGVTFAPETFTPDARSYAGQVCRGVHVTVTDRAQFEPVRTGLAFARVLRRLYPRDWVFDKLDRMIGDPRVVKAIDAGLPLASIVDSYGAQLAAFATKREKYLLYTERGCPSAAR
ncbi:MAG TPA: serine hydrolase [Polyangiaceae bacterium]